MEITDVVLGLGAGVGICLSPDGKTAYYVEWSNGLLSKVDIPTGKVTTFPQKLNFPEDVLVDWETGEIYISERTGSITKIYSKEKQEIIIEKKSAPQQLALIKNKGKIFLYTVCYD